MNYMDKLEKEMEQRKFQTLNSNRELREIISTCIVFRIQVFLSRVANFLQNEKRRYEKEDESNRLDKISEQGRTACVCVWSWLKIELLCPKFQNFIFEM